MSLIDSAKNFLWGIALKKGVTAGVKALAGILAVKAGVLSSFGVTINFDLFTASSTAALIGGLEVARNYAKQKFGWDWL